MSMYHKHMVMVPFDDYNRLVEKSKSPNDQGLACGVRFVNEVADKVDEMSRKGSVFLPGQITNLLRKNAKSVIIDGLHDQ